MVCICKLWGVVCVFCQCVGLVCLFLVSGSHLQTLCIMGVCCQPVGFPTHSFLTHGLQFGSTLGVPECVCMSVLYACSGGMHAMDEFNEMNG